MEKNFDFTEAQYQALKKRLESGRPLTADQRRFVEQYNAPKIAAGSGNASGVTDLARRLGVNRQVINWHRGRAEAPKSFSVAAWRDYLLAHGKGSTIDRVSACDAAQVEPETALAQFHAVSNALPGAIRIALASEGVNVSTETGNKIILSAWLILAAAQQAVAERQELAGIFDGDEGENVEYPTAIVAVCSRIEN